MQLSHLESNHLISANKHLYKKVNTDSVHILQSNIHWLSNFTKYAVVPVHKTVELYVACNVCFPLLRFHGLLCEPSNF
jgi:hypothetical protein